MSGSADLVDILEEGLYHTNGHGAVEHRVPGNDGDHSLGQPGQQTDEGVNADGEEVCLSGWQHGFTSATFTTC